MVTRAAAARAAAAEKAALTLSSPPSTPNGLRDDKANISTPDADVSMTDQNATAAPIQIPTPSELPTKKRKRDPNNKKLPVSMKGDWDVLPHGLGKKGDLEDIDDSNGRRENSRDGVGAFKKQNTGPVLDDSELAKSQNDVSTVEEKDLEKGVENSETEVMETQGGNPNDDNHERKPDAVVKDENVEQNVDSFKGKINEGCLNSSMTENVGGILNAEAMNGPDGNDTLKEEDVEDVKITPKGKKKAPKTPKTPKAPREKKHPYGLTPGRSPFPDFDNPSKEQCEEVYRLLAGLHGEVKAPDVIPPPSMEVTGCGEVPDLLDALLRTLLSAATTSANSNMALSGLKETFGLRTEGIGKGSINWETVHQADVATVIKSIRRGGLAVAKGNNIKKVLDAVYQQNLTRLTALKKEKETGEPADIVGATNETQKQKYTELASHKQNMLSLDYLFELTSDQVMDELVKLPGIGVKTSSCVILFCMKRPSFAVDTHVWRHCKWLGWVPEKANRDQTFSHCEVMIPNELKYALHQLFIKHGKTCPRCQAATSPGSEEWENANCPIEHLVKRTGKMKEKGPGSAKKPKSKKGMEFDSAEEEEDEPELTDASEEASPIKKAPAKKTPVKKPAASKAAVKKAKIEQDAEEVEVELERDDADEVNDEPGTRKKSPVKKTPTKKTPTKKTPTKKTPVKNAAVKKIPLTRKAPARTSKSKKVEETVEETMEDLDDDEIEPELSDAADEDFMED